MAHDFEIMQDPVTNEEYCEFLMVYPECYCKLMETHFFGGICRVEQGELINFEPKSGFEKKPVVFVSWEDAQEYARWLGGRLPTVDEWKKAAAWMPERGRFAKWCTGRDEPPTQDEANFYDFENGWALPAPHLADVDWYKPSGAYGLRGMCGNVGEWCVREGTVWQPALGGSLFRPIDFCRADAGEADHPSKRLSTFGFRLVRDCR